MKRLDFIENSFKNIYNSPDKEIMKPVSVEKPKKLEHEDKLKQIRDILASQKGSDEKLKDIEDIVKESNPSDGKNQAN